MAENGNTEKIELEQIEAEQMPEVYDSQIAACIDEYCRMKKPPIKDMSKEPQGIWNGALMYANKCLFKGREYFKDKKAFEFADGCTGTCNRYDYDLLDKVLAAYAYLCMINDKEISIMGFSFLTGIDWRLLSGWGTTMRGKSSDGGFRLSQKLRDLREESLSAKLPTAGNKAMGILAMLNHHFQWNLPGVSRENTQRASLGASELPKLGESAPVQALESKEKQDIVAEEERTTIY